MSDLRLLGVPSASRLVAVGVRRLHWLLIFIVLSGNVFADEEFNSVPKDVSGTILAIRFEGNEVTKEVILRQEMTISEGDEASYARIEESRQGIMNLGLFKRVTVRLEPGEAGHTLVYAVDEKWYILPIPKIDRDSDGDVSYGMELKFDNLFGYNQSLELLSETTDVSGGEKERVKELSYDIPRIPGTHFGFTAFLANIDTATTKVDELLGSGDYALEQDKAEVAISRWLVRHAPSQGWRGSVGSNFSNTDYTYLSGVDGLVEDRKIVEMTVGFGYTEIYEYPWHREGKEYGWSLAVAGKGIASDDDYQRLDFYLRSYNFGRLTDDDNINVQLRLGYGHGYDEGIDPYGIGDSRTLRGYERGELTGDVLALVNVEYLKPILGHRNVRAVLFTDFGNVYEEGDVDLTDLEVGAGIGLRWKIRSLVRTDLRVDYAYGFGEEDAKIYFGTRQTF